MSEEARALDTAYEIIKKADLEPEDQFPLAQDIAAALREATARGLEAIIDRLQSQAIRNQAELIKGDNIGPDDGYRLAVDDLFHWCRAQAQARKEGP